jgi:hypothetical protein
VGEHHRLDAVAQAELLEDVRDVGLDGRLADVELLPDLGVREAVGNQAKDVSFPRGQLVESIRGLRAREARELPDTRFVTVGESGASPAATVRIAAVSRSGGSSLRPKPLAPALSAS